MNVIKSVQVMVLNKLGQKSLKCAYALKREQFYCTLMTIFRRKPERAIAITMFAYAQLYNQYLLCTITL